DMAELKGRLKDASGSEGSGQEEPEGASREREAPVLLPQTAVPGPGPSQSAAQHARRRPEDEIRRMRLIMQAFEADGIELHLQPIVALPQRKIRFYEALARLRLADGTLLGPSDFVGTLERLGRAPE